MSMEIIFKEGMLFLQGVKFGKVSCLNVSFYFWVSLEKLNKLRTSYFDDNAQFSVENTSLHHHLYYRLTLIPINVPIFV